jgi:hypothetical protein
MSLWESDAGLEAEFPEDHCGWAKSGKRCLDHIQPREDRQSDPIRMNGEGKNDAQKHYKSSKSEHGFVDRHDGHSSLLGISPWFGVRQYLVHPRKNLIRCHRAALARHLGAVAKQDQGWNAANAEISGCLLVLIRVQFEKLDIRLKARRRSMKVRGHRPARAAPRCPHIDQQRPDRLGHARP